MDTLLKQLPQQLVNGLTLGSVYALVALVSGSLMLALHYLVRRTRPGKAMRATAQDREAAAMMGVDVDRITVSTFFIGSALGGAAGVLVGLLFTQIYHFVGFTAGLKGFTAAVLGAAALLPWLVPGPYVARVAGLTGLYVILSLGLNVVAGLGGLLDLGYVAFYGVGAYLYALLASPQFGQHWPFLLVLPLAVLVVALLGSPSLRLRGDYLAIVTLGFGQIASLLFLNLDRVELPFLGSRQPLNITGGPNGIINVDDIALFGLPVQTPAAYYELILLTIPPERHFCLYALQAALPLLPAKQRPLPEGDWLREDSQVVCPDPAGNVVLRIERVNKAPIP